MQTDDFDLGDGLDDDEGNFNQVSNFRESTLFLVDCSKSMFNNKDENENNYFQKCMKAIRRIYQMKIYENDKEYVGLLFYGTEHTNTGEEHNDFQYIYEVHSLKEPSAERIKELDKFTSEFDVKQFRKEYGHSDQYSLHKVYWYCSNMFSTVDKKLGLKRIIQFSDNSHPHQNNNDYQRLALNKAKDVMDIGIKIDLIPLYKKGDKFDYSEFYSDLLMLSLDEVHIFPNSADTFDEILLAVREKVHKKRPYTHLNLSLSDECSISCSVYNLVRECPKPTKIKLDKKNNVETTTITHRYAPDTGEVLFDSDTKLAIDVCDKRVVFEQDEVKAIKKFGSTGMKLLGFKSMSCLKPYMYVKPGHFLYPDEKEIEGSTTLFKTLLDRCEFHKKFILCEITIRSNSSPRLAALIPQQEVLDEEVNILQRCPPGFHLVYLPYADDFRQIDRKIEAESTPDNTEKFAKCIRKLRFPYDYTSFKNPALQKTWHQIEAIALDLEKPEEFDDLTLPDTDRHDERAGELLKEFANTIGLSNDNSSKAKRKAPDSNAVATKKNKSSSSDGIDVEAEAKSGKIDKLTIPVLKEYIKNNNISSSGTKKDDLIKAIKNHLRI